MSYFLRHLFAPVRTVAATAALGLLAVLPAYSQPADEAPAAAAWAQRQQVWQEERQNITLQRQVLQQRQAEEEKACWQRFAVEDCLRKVRTQVRDQEEVLRERELRVNNEERRARSDARLREIEQKMAAPRTPPRVEAVSRTPAATPTPVPATAAHAATAASDPAADIERQRSAQAAAAAQRAAEQAERERRHASSVAEKQAGEAQRRAQAVQALNDKQKAAAERSAKKQQEIAKRKGQPLPLPPGVSKP